MNLVIVGHCHFGVVAGDENDVYLFYSRAGLQFIWTCDILEAEVV